MGWGHASWESGVRLAQEYKPKRLIITHHLAKRTDKELRTFENEAREDYLSTDFARAGQIWELPVKKREIGEKETQEEKKTNNPIRLFESKIKEANIFITNGRYAEDVVGNTSYIVLGVVSVFMTLVNIYTQKHLLMLSTAIFALACAINLILSHSTNIKSKYIMGLFQFELICLFTFFIVSGTPEGFSILWILMLPFAGMMVFGRKRTTILSSIMLAILVFFFYTPFGRSMLIFDYSDAFLTRFPICFLAFFLFGFVLETFRRVTADELEKLRNEQEEKISEQTSALRDQNWELCKLNAELLRHKEKDEKGEEK